MLGSRDDRGIWSEEAVGKMTDCYDIERTNEVNCHINKNPENCHLKAAGLRSFHSFVLGFKGL